jgi:hypothetical protein
VTHQRRTASALCTLARRVRARHVRRTASHHGRAARDSAKHAEAAAAASVIIAVSGRRRGRGRSVRVVCVARVQQLV